MVLVSQFAFTQSHTPVLSKIKHYHEDVILSTKLQKYQHSMEQAMANMRHSIGVSVGEPYLFTLEVTETNTQNNVMKIYIALELGKYKVTEDQRAFFQRIYGDYRKEVLSLEDESLTKMQLMQYIQDILQRFKVQYIADN